MGTFYAYRLRFPGFHRVSASVREEQAAVAQTTQQLNLVDPAPRVFLAHRLWHAC